MSTAQPSGATVLGIVGAGQLARMTYQAGISMGLTARVLAVRADDAAALVAPSELGEPTSFQALERFSAACRVVTFDHELVDAGQIARLESSGRRFWPNADVVRLVQDKRLQRERLGALGFPVPSYRAITTESDLHAFGSREGWPVVAKASRGGYDGRGVWVLANPSAAASLLAEQSARGVELLAERRVAIDREVAVLIARRPSGECVVYPVAETVQVDGMCREVVVPAPITPRLAGEARELGRAIAEAIGAVGILAVELFVEGDSLVVNELAARPHNSGHYSIEGCTTSQFENHIRAVLDWPLGQPDLVQPAVATVNVLGSPETDLTTLLPVALAVPGAHVHLYGKQSRPGRKLGHVTALGPDPEHARATARRAAALLTGTTVAEGVR